MRTSLLALPVITCLSSALLTNASPLRAPPNNALSQNEQQALIKLHMSHQGPGIALPDSNAPPDDSDDNDGQSGSISISDVLGRDRSISIFASLARDVASVVDRFENNGLNATVLAPTNAALGMLPRKPWEGKQRFV